MASLFEGTTLHWRRCKAKPFASATWVSCDVDRLIGVQILGNGMHAAQDSSIQSTNCAITITYCTAFKRRSLDPHTMINDWHLIGLILIVGYSGRLVSLILSPFPTGVAVSPSPPSTVTATNKSERERSKQLISAAPEGHTYRYALYSHDGPGSWHLHHAPLHAHHVLSQIYTWPTPNT
ncbi:hypothetical protein BJV77DRAFT_1001298 [Russula vinacea]|nr:hypothetical protein BJV77DRAFT_1001298 [Russula vinacea]